MATVFLLEEELGSGRDAVVGDAGGGGGEGTRSGRKKPPPPPLQERVPLGRRAAWAWRLAGLAVLLLLLALLALRLLRHHGGAGGDGGVWRVALVCEAWFAALCALNVSAKWSPVRFVTRPENLVAEGRTPSTTAAEYGELPAVDMLVTTADPALEPPLVTVNTVLSLLALDYPRAGERLACYVSDDGCSPLTCHALREAAGHHQRAPGFAHRQVAHHQGALAVHGAGQHLAAGIDHRAVAVVGDAELRQARLDAAKAGHRQVQLRAQRPGAEPPSMAGGPCDRRTHTRINGTQNWSIMV